jgi:hypothetical protein
MIEFPLLRRGVGGLNKHRRDPPVGSTKPLAFWAMGVTELSFQCLKTRCTATFVGVGRRPRALGGLFAALRGSWRRLCDPARYGLGRPGSA